MGAVQEEERGSQEARCQRPPGLSPLPACGPQYPPTSVFFLGSAVFRDTLGSQFSQHVIQVIGIWVAMASEIRAKLCLVVHLIPDDSIRLARGTGGSNGKDEAAIPGH